MHSRVKIALQKPKCLDKLSDIYDKDVLGRKDYPRNQRKMKKITQASLKKTRFILDNNERIKKCLGKYTINKDGTVDAHDVDLSFQDINRIPVPFRKVSGDFNCSFNKLATLDGAPKTVGGDFNCNVNRLVTLEWGPARVGGSFTCFNNRLSTLKGAPQEVADNFLCAKNRLSTLDGAPVKVGGIFDCSDNRLRTLEGAPRKAKYFWCVRNRLRSLKGAPREVGTGFDCSDNVLATLEGCPQKVGRYFKCSGNPRLKISEKERIVRKYRKNNARFNRAPIGIQPFPK